MTGRTASFITAIAASLLALFSTGGNATSAAYTNYTVGSTAGWFFNVSTNSSSADYSAWASGLVFNLGDFLIFNTNTNETVVQTYNVTTYNSCSADDASDNDTFIYDSGSTVFGQPLTIAIPLTIQGPNYFFSDAGDDGVQCMNGMRFKIIVKHGMGLPPSLSRPPPPPYTSPPVAEAPPVFEGSGGGQGGSISGCEVGIGGARLTFAAAAVMTVQGLGML